MKTSPTFDEAYKSLNPEQKKAVDTIDGPVMVVAGPGTGKTQILTLRIANIIAKTDTESENILALTFTEAAAANMRKRLANLIGSDAYRVTITTFHSFATNIIQSHPESFPSIIGARPATEVDQIRIIEKIILDTKLVLLKPFGDTLFYAKDIRAKIDELKREGVTPQQYLDIVNRTHQEYDEREDKVHQKGAHKGKVKGEFQKLEKKILKNKELAQVYEQYQLLLRERKLFDFADMLVEVLQTLSVDEQLLLQLQEEHQYVLVDEHQDTNNAQNKILERLLSFHDNPNIFVVGDEKQAIFRFQGASLENFYYFKDLYPKAELVTLKKNYRSEQKILDLAHSLVPTETELEAHGDKPDSTISVVSFPTSDQELFFVAHDIEKHNNEGVPLHEIAVLYRDNKDAFAIGRELDRLGIAHQIESDQDLYQNNVVGLLVDLLLAVAHIGEDRYVTKVLYSPLFDIDPVEVHAVIKAAARARTKSLWDFVRDAKNRRKITIHSQDAFDELYANLASWKKAATTVSLVTFVEEVLRGSGLLQYVLSVNEQTQGLAALNAFFDELKSLEHAMSQVTLADFAEYHATMLEHNMKAKRRTSGGKEGLVRLMTAHRAKGLEFSHVYIVHAYNGKWGGKRVVERLPLLDEVYSLVAVSDQRGVDVGGSEAAADERRLMYVALTRAKNHVTITYPSIGVDGRELVPSQFIAELDPALVDEKDAVDHVDQDRFAQEKFSKPQPSQKLKKLLDPQFVQDVFLNQGLSVSALNNYLRSPWQFFFRNLVRVPEATSKQQMYGIAVHAVLQELFDVLKIGEEPDKSWFIARFEEYLGRQALSPVDYDDTLDLGHSMLSAWYDEYHTDWNTNVQTELRINGVELVVDDTPIRLTGVLDKLELVPGTDNHVIVVDYKTGKPRSRNDILGKTKNSTGDYYRQLVFYKLLLRYFCNGKYIMDAGVIDFIHHNEKGKFHREYFEIGDEEVDELEVLIKDSVRGILDLSFAENECDAKVCDYCDLVTLLQLQ